MRGGVGGGLPYGDVDIFGEEKVCWVIGEKLMVGKIKIKALGFEDGGLQGWDRALVMR